MPCVGKCIAGGAWKYGSGGSSCSHGAFLAAGLAGATLTNRLHILSRADLVSDECRGRITPCRANYATMNTLLCFLTERRREIAAVVRLHPRLCLRTCLENVMKRFHAHVNVDKKRAATMQGICI